MASGWKRRLGDRLVSAGIVKRDDVERAAEESEGGSARIGDVLLRWGLADERDIYRQLAAQRRRDFFDADSLFEALDPALADEFARAEPGSPEHVPLCRTAGGRLRVAVSDADLDASALAACLGVAEDELEVLLVTPTDLRRLQWAIDLKGVARHRETAAPLVEADILSDDLRGQSAGVGLFDSILADAVALNASDVHFEARADGVRIRLRVDGALRDRPQHELDAAQLRGVLNVVKVRAGLDIMERRRPQNGRFAERIAGHHYDFRVQTQPSLHGEAAVLRMLSSDMRPFTIERLGFLPELAATYTRALQSPSGLILVAGPSGSGKSTTLYAGLQLIASDVARKIITVEDPIEYALDGIQQTQVDPELDFTFSQAVRTFVRQDPDVILVGEIRDPETALEAIRASQTGHLVLSTIHATDAVDALQRLADLGLHPNSIASELLAVFAQRLARRICPACRTPHEPDRSLLREVFPANPPSHFQSFRGDGCEHCRGFGLRGRISVGEHLPSTPSLRLAVSRGVPLDELRHTALAGGMRTMRSEALDLVAEGVIPLEELPRIFALEYLTGAQAEGEGDA